MDNGTEAFVSIFCIGRGIWFPKELTAGEAKTIDSIANTRADVGVQWLLFTQTMSSAKTAITLLRDMQQLIGHVERITEMLETLDRVAEAKKDEKKASTLTAQRIEFKVRDPATWTVLQKDGPNHLGLWYNAIPGH